MGSNEGVKPGLDATAYYGIKALIQCFLVSEEVEEVQL